MGEILSDSEKIKEVEGIVLNIDYFSMELVNIRITVKGNDAFSYDIIDRKFRPYFYFSPEKNIDIEKISLPAENGKNIRPLQIKKVSKIILGVNTELFQIYLSNPSVVPRFSEYLGRYGRCYEYDIPFAKRYAIDKGIIPFKTYKFRVAVKEDYELISMENGSEDSAQELNIMCFDIETYNPGGKSVPEKDPILMISYSFRSQSKTESKVITYKNIGLPFVVQVKDEAESIKRFLDVVNELDVDVLSGYNSANFDIDYLIKRANVLGIKFNLSRNFGDTRIEKHGLVNKVKIGGRVHIDMYLVIKFIAVVDAAEHLLKLNSYTLKNVYEEIGGKKLSIQKQEIYNMWDGEEEDRKTLAEYNLDDSFALQKVYDTFFPIMIELSRITGSMISDTSVSTTGQLVEYMLMRYAFLFNEIIPNKPDEKEIRRRLQNPVEGAFVKTPDPGVYNNLAIFDFKSLYPSVIIAHNIDPSSICVDCEEYYESPIGIKFSKNRKSIMPTILTILINERKKVKKIYKQNPGDISLGSRSQALKIPANAFYGYLGYSRSRWYSRECAASITAYSRRYIQEAIKEVENGGLRVLYADTDSVVLLLESKTKDYVLELIKKFNGKLPDGMELELENFYVRGIFVSKKNEKSNSLGAKKKYAMITESGRIKIRGFELVRRDWSKIARDTQREVLETILKEGSIEKSIGIIKDVIKKLRDGEVPLSELVINTHLRKGIDSYDIKSPELAAAKKAIENGKKRSEIEHSVIGYVITKAGSSISDKAELLEFAKDYDAEYYINNQIMPATMRILKELNLNEDELKGIGTQKKL